MTATLPSHEVAAGVTTWLSAFGNALSAGDTAAAAALFTEDCFWRDLVAFTWNIKTLEGRAAISAMLVADAALGAARRLEDHRRRGAGRRGRRDRGLDRLRDRRGPRPGAPAAARWPVLDVADDADELRGHEDAAGRPARRASSTARTRPGTWLEQREQEASELGVTEQPYVLIIGGGQGGHRARRAAAPAGRATIIMDTQPAG